MTQTSFYGRLLERKRMERELRCRDQDRRSPSRIGEALSHFVLPALAALLFASDAITAAAIVVGVTLLGHIYLRLGRPTA